MRSLIFSLLSAFVFTLSGQAQEADSILGRWLSESGKAKVEIFKTGDKYYGKIVWLKTPLNEQGQPKVDKNNPDPAKRNHKLMGLLLLKSFVYDGKGVWKSGTIYDPEKGKEYNCIMTLKSNGTLSIRGYVGISLLGRSTIWARTE